MDEEIPTFTGKAAKEFLEYDKRDLTPEEKKSLEESRRYYLDHCKS